jgi:hypothetical protein
VPTGVTPADYPGQLQNLTVNRRLLPEGRIADPDGLLPGRLADSAVIEASLRPGGATAAIAAIFSIGTDRQEEALLLAQVGHDLMLRSRLRAARFRLREPALLLRGAAGGPGDSVEVRGVVRPGSFSLEAVRPGHLESITMPLTPSLTWVLVSPLELASDPFLTPLGWLWIAGLLIPAGYWARRADLLGAGGRGAWWIALAAALPLALWGVPALAAIAPSSIGDAVAAVSGLGFGATAAALLVRREVPVASPGDRLPASLAGWQA